MIVSISTLFRTLSAAMSVLFLISCTSGRTSEPDSFVVDVEPNGFSGMCAFDSPDQFGLCDDVELTTGDHWLWLGTLTRIPFNIDAVGIVSFGPDYDGISANGGTKKITLLPVPVKIEVGGYEGIWSIKGVRDKDTTQNPNDLRGNAVVQLVPSAAVNQDKSRGAQYRLSIGRESSAEKINLDGSGGLTFGNGKISTEAMFTPAKRELQFNNVKVSVNEQTETGVAWTIHQVTPLPLSGYQELILVPGVRFGLQSKGASEEFIEDRFCKKKSPAIVFPHAAFEIECLEGITDLFKSGRMFYSIQGATGRRIEIREPDGTFVDTLSHPQLQLPHSLAFDYSKNHLLVTDEADGEVFVFDRSGMMVTSFGLEVGQGSMARGVAVASDGTRYLANAGNSFQNRRGIRAYRQDNSFVDVLDESINCCSPDTPIASSNTHLVSVGRLGAAPFQLYRWLLTDQSYLGALGGPIVEPGDSSHRIVLVGGGEMVIAGRTTGGKVSVHRYGSDGAYIGELFSDKLAEPVIAADLNDNIWIQRHTIRRESELIRFDLSGALDGIPVQIEGRSQLHGMVFYKP